MSESHKRKRSRAACQPCRELKRKCDGALPCAACLRFEYECQYKETSGRRKKQEVELPVSRARLSSTSATSTRRNMENQSASPSSLRPLQANSGAAFVRRLALNIDPLNAPRMHLFAWNVFLGARDAAGTATSRPLTDMLSLEEMKRLAAEYFEKVHPCYGFIDRQVFERRMRDRWQDHCDADPFGDAVLCGVAALGSVFSQVSPSSAELDYVETAKTILEHSLSDSPSITSVTAWLLRVTYLRLAGTPHAAWMASCTLMHMAEAASLNCESTNESVLQTASGDVDPETRRRLFGVAQHLNTWISFDIGRSKVTLLYTDLILATPRESDFTIELLELLPHSALLDPTMELDGLELEKTLRIVLDRVHSEPPSIMAHCNLVLCLCRRLQSLNLTLNGPLLDQVLSVTANAVDAARTMVVKGTPWHHMANVPFQVLCILLAIDTPVSTSQLKTVMVCLGEIAAKWRTNATQEALKTASLLIFMYKKQKERSVSSLDDILKLYPVAQQANQNSLSFEAEETDWLDMLMTEMPTLQDMLSESGINEDLTWAIGSRGV